LERWGATLPAVFGLNRPRFELTGLEEPDELWERLQEATSQANALATSNKKLASRVRMLERQLAEVGGLTDDELVAELPRRMTRALESAQGVANEIVRRARKHEASIRQKADDSAAAIVSQAENQAAGIVRQAAGEAAARIASAEAEALDIVGAAHARRDQIVSELEGQAATLRQRIKLLERNQARLVQAYEVVGRTLYEARRVLACEPAGPEDAPGAGPPPVRPAPGTNGARPGARRVPAAARAAPEALPPEETHLRVYDWSPVASQAG
jgi:chaperonin cofactor prefoldin